MVTTWSRWVSARVLQSGRDEKLVAVLIWSTREYSILDMSSHHRKMRLLKLISEISNFVSFLEMKKIIKININGRNMINEKIVGEKTSESLILNHFKKCKLFP